MSNSNVFPRLSDEMRFALMSNLGPMGHTCSAYLDSAYTALVSAAGGVIERPEESESSIGSDSSALGSEDSSFKPLQRFNPIRAVVNPDPQGRYIRYEDHLASLEFSSSSENRSLTRWSLITGTMGGSDAGLYVLYDDHMAASWQSFVDSGEPDVDFAQVWREAGGNFHGPHVETGVMPEATLLPFLEALRNGRASDRSMHLFVRKSIEMAAACLGLMSTMEGHLSKDFVEGATSTMKLWAETQDAASAMAGLNDRWRERWCAAGGSFHGPRVETGSMPQSNLLVFLKKVHDGSEESLNSEGDFVAVSVGLAQDFLMLMDHVEGHFDGRLETDLPRVLEMREKTSAAATAVLDFQKSR